MKNYLYTGQKRYALKELLHQVARWQFLGKKIVFTNGGFDILHRGHIRSLETAASFGDILIVGLNTDASVKISKGNQRPINCLEDRSLLLASLEVVDAVIPFDEETPINLIMAIRPDVLVKGGDYTIDRIVGAQDVIGWGGRVQIVPFEQGYSTTGLIEKITRL
jgi:D-glycero-beta-D-manno-heptose 1-phosphate adenylyltransferase